MFIVKFGKSVIIGAGKFVSNVIANGALGFPVFLSKLSIFAWSAAPTSTGLDPCELDLNNINGYDYNEGDGKWYESPLLGPNAWLTPADADMQNELNQLREYAIQYYKLRIGIIDPNVNDLYQGSQNWRPSSPIALDLDGDGLETTAIGEWDAVRFDHNNNGINTGTGWINPDDGLLVLDRNGNGNIDSGRELFGDNTYLNLDKGNRYERNARMVIWGLTEQEAEMACGHIKQKIKEKYKGTVHCVAGRLS